MRQLRKEKDEFVKTINNMLKSGNDNGTIEITIKRGILIRHIPRGLYLQNEEQKRIYQDQS